MTRPLLPHDRTLRRIVLALFVLVPVAFGVLVQLLEQDANWDLRNYHWYDAYAALTGRLDVDMGAAQTPSYYNPTLDVPFYIAAQALPARLFGFLLGMLQGANFVLLYALAWYALAPVIERQRALAAAVIAGVGIVGGGHLGLVGTIFYDNVVSLLVFAALGVVLASIDVLREGALRSALARCALAGFFVGCGVGLKLPTQIFAIGVCFGLLFVPGPFMRRFWMSFVCGLGVIAGFVLLGGWWMWELWTHFGNPLFPYFNDIIRSDWALPESYRDDRYLPKTIGAALSLPFRLFLDGQTAGEIAFRDARILAAYIVLLATPAMLLIARKVPTGGAPPAVDAFAARYLAAAAALAYVVWAPLFAIYRYVIPLEMLAPLLIVVCMATWPLSFTRKLSLAIAMLGFVVVTAQPGTWGRKPWGAGLGGTFIDVSPPPIADPAHTLILMTGFAPTAFVIPAFPPEIAFLRPYSYLAEPHHAMRFMDTMRARIAAHTGPIYVLQAEWEKWAGEKALPAFGLAPTLECRKVASNLDDEIELCAVRRVPPEM